MPFAVSEGTHEAAKKWEEWRETKSEDQDNQTQPMQGVLATPDHGISSYHTLNRAQEASQSISVERAETIRLPGLNHDTESIVLSVRCRDKQILRGRLHDVAKQDDKGLITIISLWRFVLGAISRFKGERDICLDHVKDEIRRSPPGMETNPVIQRSTSSRTTLPHLDN